MRGLGLTACLAVLALAGVAPAAAQTPEEERPLPAPVPVADDALTAALETGELSEAEYALERARSLFQLGAGAPRVRLRRPPRPARRDADPPRPRRRAPTTSPAPTAPRRSGSSAAPTTGPAATSRRRFRSATAGPSQESLLSPLCGGNVCVHWVDEPGNSDAPPDEDVDPVQRHPRLGRPDARDLGARLVPGDRHDRLPPAALRRSTLPNNGGDVTLDVYLDDLGADVVFGYCTSDDPSAGSPDVYAVSAYCVIDNDFAPEQYGDEHSPQEFLEVTSAHEFHHASQFAYDWLEDYWLMEGTATNIEETVYPAIDDNVNFLRAWSPLTRPGSPLDRGGLGDSEYGSWIFWRFLAGEDRGRPEHRAGDLGARGRLRARRVADDYSLQAVTRELTQRGLAFGDVFAQFATANRLGDYDDAETPATRSRPERRRSASGGSNRVVGWRSWEINHLASRFVSFTPGLGARATGKLRVEVRLPKYGARATVVVLRDRRLRHDAPAHPGSVRATRVCASRSGAESSSGSRSSSRTAARASRSCWVFPGPPSTSCFGRPLDDNRAFQLRAQLVR